MTSRVSLSRCQAPPDATPVQDEVLAVTDGIETLPREYETAARPLLPG